MRRRSSDLPTVPPPFNVVRFAKDSDATVGAARRNSEDDAGAKSETRIATRPRIDAAISDEVWAKRATGILAISMPLDELKKMPLDHRAGYLLSWMDGSIDLATLVDVASLPREDVLRIVRELIASGVVSCR